MKKYKITEFITKHVWVTFLINIKSLIDIGIWIYSLFNGNTSKTKTETEMTSSNFPFGYNELMLLIVSIILFYVLKSIKVRFDKINQRNEEQRLFILSVLSYQNNFDTDDKKKDEVIKGVRVEFEKKLRLNGYNEDLGEKKIRELINRMVSMYINENH